MSNLKYQVRSLNLIFYFYLCIFFQAKGHDLVTHIAIVVAYEIV